MTPIARVDERACAAHGDCLDVAPQAFALSDDDVAVVVGPPRPTCSCGPRRHARPSPSR
jgi:ferredoxin